LIGETYRERDSIAAMVILKDEKRAERWSETTVTDKTYFITDAVE
jgi:hypothetical protein